MEDKLNFQRPSCDRRNSIFGQLSNRFASEKKNQKFANQSTNVNSDSLQIDFEEIKRAGSNDKIESAVDISQVKKDAKKNYESKDKLATLTASPLAPLMADVPPADFKMMSEIDIGIQNYTLKCIHGKVNNTFHYLPLNKTGLVIGTGKPAKKLVSDNRKYWNFEECEFAEEHCYIFYKPEYMVFIINDLSYKEARLLNVNSKYIEEKATKQAYKGTWLSIPNLIASHDWFNLHSTANYKREFKIVVESNELPFRFTDQEGEVISSLHQWCTQRQALDQFPIFKKLGFQTINDLRNPDLPILFKKMVQQGHYPNENQRVEQFNQMFEEWMRSQLLSENNGENPSVLVLNIKLSHSSEKETQYRLDGQRVLIVSSDHKKASEANLVLDFPWLFDFEMVIDYSDRIFDAKSPVSGLVLQTFQPYHREFPLATVFYKMRRNENTVLQPGTIVRLMNTNFLVERYNTGVVAMIGNRQNMEDAYFISQDIGFDSILKVSIFCVIDGHGGDYCAQFLQKEMIATLNQCFKEMNMQQLETVPFGTTLEEVINQTYLTLDRKYNETYPEISKNAGAVVVSCFIIGNQLYCINLGDSRAVICRNGRAMDLSQDHKASLASEVNRVKLKGGFVMGGRVGGRLAITRAFGDHGLKLQIDENGEVHNQEYLTVIPEIRQYEIDPTQDEFILLASDGLFDRLSSQECCDYILKELKSQTYGENNLQSIAERLANIALLRERVKDNVTVMIVALNRGFKNESEF